MESSPEPGDVALLPYVGTLVGATAGTLAYVASRISSPRIGAAVAFGAPVALTGALHLDGFLDVCDAAFAPVDVERRREILRDPRHGSFAFAGGAIVATVQYAALREIDARDWAAALALSESVARYAALLAARTLPRSADVVGTAARAFATPSEDRTLAIQGAMLVACAHAYGGIRTAAGVAGVLAGSVAVARALARRFGGTLGGDGYGFCITVAQAAMLCACA